MNTNPTVTVVIPCFNYGRYLARTLKSVAAQTYTDWECIIVDDGSTDETPLVATEWVESDPRFIYLRQDNAGLAAARNAGLYRASGEYIQFLDADDLIHPYKLSRQTALLTALPECSHVYSGFHYFHESTGTSEAGLSYQPYNTKSLLHRLIFDWEYGFTIPIHALLFRKNHLAKVEGFAAGMPTHEDIDLYLRLAMMGTDFIHHPEDFAEYLLHPTSMTRNYTHMQQGYLMALGNAMAHAPSSRLKGLIFVRYAMEVAQCFAHKARGRKIGLRKAIFSSGHPVASLFSLLLCPIFAASIVIRKRL